MSSVYFWDLDDGFAGVVLLKKSMCYFDCSFLGQSDHSARPATPKGKSEGGWDSIHVFEAIDRARTAHYKLTSTVILRLSTESEALGEMDLSGNMTRQIEQDMPVQDDSSHIVNVGKLVEDMELKMRNLLRTRTGAHFGINMIADNKQRKFILARRRTWSETYEVPGFSVSHLGIC